MVVTLSQSASLSYAHSSQIISSFLFYSSILMVSISSSAQRSLAILLPEDPTLLPN